MLGRAITAACSLMVRRVVAKVTRWLGMMLIRVSCQKHVMKSSQESERWQSKMNDGLRCKSACLRSTMSKFKIFCKTLRAKQHETFKFEKAKLMESMFRIYPSFQLHHTRKSISTWKKATEIDPLEPQKWTKLQVELIQLSQLSSISTKLWMEPPQTDFLLLIWLTLQALSVKRKLTRKRNDWRKAVLSTFHCPHLEMSLIFLQIKLLVKVKEKLSRTENLH